jgi:hypothetical protein
MMGEYRRNDTSKPSLLLTQTYLNIHIACHRLVTLCGRAVLPSLALRYIEQGTRIPNNTNRFSKTGLVLGLEI